MKLTGAAFVPGSNETSVGESVTSAKSLSLEEQRSNQDDLRVTDKNDLAEAAKKLNDTLSAFNIREKFVIDGQSGEVVVYLINAARHEIVGRIPPDKVINAARQLQEYIGLFINEWI